MLVGADSYVRYLIKLTWPRAETKKNGVPPEVNAFFGPKISVFGPKIRFLPYDPNFGQ